MDIIWQEPPPANQGRKPKSKAQEYAEACKKNPGEWAFYGRCNAGTGSYMKKRYGLEATTRNALGGECDLYLRWVEPQVDTTTAADMLTAKEAATYCGISVRELARWEDADLGPVSVVDYGVRLYPVESIIAWKRKLRPTEDAA